MRAVAGTHGNEEAIREVKKGGEEEMNYSKMRLSRAACRKPESLRQACF